MLFLFSSLSETLLEEGRSESNPRGYGDVILHIMISSFQLCDTQHGIVLKDSGPCYNYLPPPPPPPLQQPILRGENGRGKDKALLHFQLLAFISSFTNLWRVKVKVKLGAASRWRCSSSLFLSLFFSFPSSLLHVSSSPFCLHLMSIFFTPFRFPFLPFNLQSFMEVCITPATQVSGSQTAF